jgi:hypothetical protein
MSTAVDTAPAISHEVARGARLAQLAQRNGALIVLVLVCIIGALSFESFATADNLRNIAVQSAFLALVACGMTLVILTGGIDLSVGLRAGPRGRPERDGLGGGACSERSACPSWCAGRSGCCRACSSARSGSPRSSSRSRACSGSAASC